VGGHPGRPARILSAEDLLAGSSVVHEVPLPPAVLRPGTDPQAADGVPGRVRLRPLTVAALTVIARAARDDSSLIPLLLIKESLVEPALSLDGIRQLHVGLVHYLVSQINLISGLTADGAVLDDASDAPSARMHLLLARHFGWTPEQVSQLTPGQVAIYLAGVEKLLHAEAERR
jgi:hypothetical protein